MNTCTVQLLGPVLVDWETGEPPRFRSQRTMALLGYLTAEQRPVARDALATLLWPDETLTTAKTNLRRELHNLDNILPGCWQTDRQVVAFLPAAGTQVDIYELLRLEESEQWSTAADLIRGEFLEGVFLEDNLEFESWLLGERERWRQRAERVLRRAVKSQVSSSNNAQALRFARRLLQQLPWHEEMHRQVMTLLAQRGQRSAALQQYEQCKELLREELGVEVSAETQALYERIRDTATFALHNIPAPTIPLIGRKQELALLKDWLEDADVRLITITGAGGMGKTRLALALGQQLLEQTTGLFNEGIYFVSLASLDDPAQIVATIAGILKFPFQGQDSRSSQEQLLDYLRQKEMLLNLDNFEHLLPGAEIVTDILQAAPGIQILVTSRERLNLQGEQVLPLHGLVYDNEPVLPDTGKEQTEAGQLFLTAAERVRPGFSLSDGDVAQLRRICRLVEGMPLALELAATWVDTLSLTAVATEVERGIGFLETDMRNIPPRHRSIRAVFDTSWQRLSAEQQQIFVKLSIFRGGFTRDAAEVVAGATAKLLSHLVNRSLLRYQQERDRYEIHELFRQYAQSLMDPTLDAAIHRLHLDYFSSFAKQVQAWQENLGQETNQERLESEFGNFRVALDWSLQDPACALQGLDLAAELEWFWKFGGYFEEGAMWLARSLDAANSDADPTTRAHALKAAGDLELNRTGDREKAKVLFNESLAIYQALADKRGVVSTLSSLGHMELQFGNHKEANGYLEEAHLLAQYLDENWTPSSLLLFVCLSQLALAKKNIKAARSFCERGLAIAKQIGALFQVGVFFDLLSWVAAEEKDWPKSRTNLKEALAIYQNTKNTDSIAHVHRSLGELARCEKQYEVARIHYENSLKGYRELGALPKGVGVDLFNLGQTYLMMDQIEEAIGYFQQCLEWGLRIDNPSLVHDSLEGIANTNSAKHQPLHAARLWGATESIRESLSEFLHMPDRLAHEHFVNLARKELDEKTFNAVWAGGRKMSIKEAVAYAQDSLQIKQQ